jgi:hypothetical protein
LARNRDFKNSPLEAVASTNAEALKATPREKVLDSIQRHRPLDGVAFVPPGFPDRYGRVFRYEEGTDMQRDAASGGDLGRWPGIVSLYMETLFHRLSPPSIIHCSPFKRLMSFYRSTFPTISREKANLHTRLRRHSKTTTGMTTVG